jgi:hypothetical protein
MSLQDFTNLAEIAASAGVIVSLIFVGYQMRQNTNQLQRNEHNSTMTQWSTIRMALVDNRDVAEIWRAGLHGERELDATDQFRLESLLAEQLWAAYHVWERTRRGILTEGTFQEAVAPLAPAWLSTLRGAPWWSTAKRNYPPLFVADIDAALTKFGVAPSVNSHASPSAFSRDGSDG